MITSWDIYWITRFDGICALMVFVGSACLVVAFACFLAGIEHGRALYYKKQMITFCCVSVFSFAIGVMIPTTKEFAAIYLTPKIANNEQVQKLPDNAMKFLNGKLEQWIADMATEKKKK